MNTSCHACGQFAKQAEPAFQGEKLGMIFAQGKTKDMIEMPEPGVRLRDSDVEAPGD
jgi:hypothetical protein